MALIIIVLILVIAAYYFYSNYTKNTGSPYTSLLSGFWRAPKTFLIESDTELISMYLESNLQDGWLIIKKEDGFILNDQIEVSLKEVPSEGARVVKYEVYYGGIESDDFPNRQSILYYPDCSKLILYKGDRIFAVLYKDCELTEDAMENHFAIKAEASASNDEELEEEEEEEDDLGESLEEDTEVL